MTEDTSEELPWQDPEAMEQAYRSNPAEFEALVRRDAAYGNTSPALAFWLSRLNYEVQHPLKPAANDALHNVQAEEYQTPVIPLYRERSAMVDPDPLSDTLDTGKQYLPALLIICAAACLFIKLPQIFTVIQENTFYMRLNAYLCVGFVGIYFLIRRQATQAQMALYFGLSLLLIVFGYFFPIPDYLSDNNPEKAGQILDETVRLRHRNISDLVSIHLPFVFWTLCGLAYIRFQRNDLAARMGYLRFSIELTILSAIILLGGAVLTGATIGLFELIHISIWKFYSDWIVMFGLASAPIVAAHISETPNNLATRIIPLIARIFAPLVLITLIIYLPLMAVQGFDIFHKRENLLILNLVLIGVIAITVFAITGAGNQSRRAFFATTLLLLTIVAGLINAIALSGIIYRIGSFGFSPNRLAVLGGNILIFIHLILLVRNFIRIRSRHFDDQNLQAFGIIEDTIARYLPVYTVWSLVVVFIFPLIFWWQ